jgi:hypothetical protein
MNSDDEDDDQDEAEEKKRAEQAHTLQNTKLYNEQNYSILPRFSDSLRELVTSPQTRISFMEDSIKHFKCIIPKVVARSPVLIPTKIDT